MDAPWDTMRDILAYCARAHAVSVDCRLTMHEEYALLAVRHQISSDSPRYFRSFNPFIHRVCH